MALFPQPPPPARKWGLDFNFSRAIADADRSPYEVRSDLGLPFTRVADCAYPPFMSASAVERLQDQWDARECDVFLVFPVAPMFKSFLAYAAALVEQCDVSEVDTSFPRWVDAAVSRRGWEFIERIDASACSRRLLCTHSPPWLFPCRNSGLPRKPFPNGWTHSALAAHASYTASSVDNGHPPRIAVMVSDPRLMIMKEMQFALLILQGHQENDVDFNFPRLLEYLTHRSQEGLLPGYGGGGIITAAAWAEAEAADPDRVRLFFIEDFILQPEVAMRGLARFLDAPTISDATGQVILRAGEIGSLQRESRTTPAGDLLDLQHIGSVIEDFEKLLASVPDAGRGDWEEFIGLWLNSSNSRMVSMAQSALAHSAWDPPRWWAAHSARLCRPCLFFPRGTCVHDDCGFCHGPNHAKPKRPSKSRRQRKRGMNAGDRTPSPCESERSSENRSLPSVDLEEPAPPAAYAAQGHGSAATANPFPVPAPVMWTPMSNIVIPVAVSAAGPGPW
mmetsp:Transcript_13372/g.31356  ORF Transcript_13372/g.31356 Transcript_13372/m.31356 type:complete len:505 (-) Transcript_13372:186-1700(-)